MSDCSYLEHKHIHQWSKLMKMGSNPISKCVQTFWENPAKFWKIERKMIGSKGKSFKILRKKLPWAQMFQILAAFRLFFLSPQKTTCTLATLKFFFEDYYIAWRTSKLNRQRRFLFPEAPEIMRKLSAQGQMDLTRAGRTSDASDDIEVRAPGTVGPAECDRLTNLAHTAHHNATLLLRR